VSINQEILTFSTSLPLWMRDLVRRIAQQTTLAPNDLNQVLANLKATEKLCAGSSCTPLGSSHISGRSTSLHSPTVLLSISDVRNANNLAPKQTMPFAGKGLTIIYGYNGSGKSGYGRILRQLCRSRHDEKQAIIGNVYGPKPLGPATATIAYRVGTQDFSTQWKDGAPSPDELSHISVFDATTAPLYADKQNRIEFLPMGLDILPALGEACRALSGMLDIEIAALVTKINIPLPVMKSQKFNAFFSRLSPTGAAKGYPSAQEIDAHCSWTAALDDKLLTLENEIRKLSEPAQVLARNTRLIQAIDALHSRLDGVAKQLNAKSIEEARAKLETLRSAEEAAAIAARGRFENDPLPNAPLTVAWRLLYAQAEAFNAEQYPGSPFPETGADRVCLLCQQPYNARAAERMARFKAFLEDTTQQEASRRERELGESILALRGISLPSTGEIELPLAQLREIRTGGDIAIKRAAEISAALSAVRVRLADCLSGKAEFSSIVEADTSALASLVDIRSSLAAESTSLSNSIQDSAALGRLKEEHLELLDQKNCHGNRLIFHKRLSDLETSEALRRCRAQCGTDGISRKNTQLREAYLTSDFEKRIKDEVKFIGLDYLPLTVQGKTEKGVGYMGVALTKTGRNPSSDILSEGEFRGLALACFFAEIASIPGHDGIVVDDPVSSLDHLHITRIAERLVVEAKNRPQVIVFTHDMGFYYELWTAAAEAGIPVQRNWIYSQPNLTFGIVKSDDSPWQVKGVRDRMAELETMLLAQKRQPGRSPDEALRDMEAFYTKLRESWERAVEECLFNKVVGRFQTDVRTQSLRGVIVTDDDHKIVYFAMKRASEYSGHDRPAGRQPTLRTIDEMRADLEELRKFVQDTKTRRDATEKLRDALVMPGKAHTH
jgi:hypothetical protein